MQIEQGNAVTLSDNVEYIVLSKVAYNNKNYLYLASLEKAPKMRICCEKTEDSTIILDDVKDVELIKHLVLLFSKDIKSIL
jgi:hypothetical protein